MCLEIMHHLEKNPQDGQSVGMSGSIGKRPVLGVEMNQMQFPGITIII
jgi:hypothetical protein